MHTNESTSSTNLADENSNQASDNELGNNELPNQTAFFDKPRNVNILMYSFYAICIVLVALEFVVHRHVYLSFDKIPAFYAIYGFGACVVLVVIAKLMRHVVMRGEHYYDERADEGNRIVEEVVKNKTANTAYSELPDDMDELGLRKPANAGDKHL
jgi:hypothetical protein